MQYYVLKLRFYLLVGDNEDSKCEIARKERRRELGKKAKGCKFWSVEIHTKEISGAIALKSTKGLVFAEARCCAIPSCKNRMEKRAKYAGEKA